MEVIVVREVEDSFVSQPSGLLSDGSSLTPHTTSSFAMSH
jgi:hypothetical protein